MKNKPLSTRGEKIKWLLLHQPLWEGWPNERRQKQSVIVAKMKAEGLVSKVTYPGNISLNNLIADARTLRRMGKVEDT